jgi:hypothetical protein
MLSPYRFYLRCPVCRERILKDNDGKELTKWANGD